MACEQKLSNYIWCLALFLLLTWTSEIFGSSRDHNSVNSVFQAMKNQTKSTAPKCYCPFSKDGSSKFGNSPLCNYCKRGYNNIPATTAQPSLELQQPNPVENEVPAASGEDGLQSRVVPKSRHQQKSSCSGCRRETTTTNYLSETELQQLRIEEIKLQILKRLRMEGRPKATISRNMVPTPIMEWNVPYITADIAEKNLEDYYAKTEQMIIMSEIKEYPLCPTTTSDPAGCFSFVLNENLLDKEVNSAELWVFKLRDERDKHNQTYLVTDFVRDAQSNVKRTNTVAIRDTSIKDGWLKFDLTTTIQRWIKNPNTSVQMLEVSCKTCVMDSNKVPVSSDPGERPFIVINFNHEDDKKRYRRGIVCEENIRSCCKESLYVNFTDIDWNDWIFQPEGYYANYCRGNCIDEITLGVYKHTTVIQKYLWKNRKLLSPSKLADLAPCCTSTRTSHLQILYLDGAKNVRMELIPNMVVESCGCN